MRSILLNYKHAPSAFQRDSERGHQVFGVSVFQHRVKLATRAVARKGEGTYIYYVASLTAGRHSMQQQHLPQVITFSNQSKRS
jgi:hypothetical protein